MDHSDRSRTSGAPALEVVARAADESVVFKPAGLSSERGPGDRGDCLAERAQRTFGWPQCWLPHRLDRPTRGLLVVAGSKEAAARCSAEIQAGAWTKWYTARIPGGAAAQALAGPHKAYLKRVGRLAQAVRSGGDPSHLTILAVETAADDPSTAHALIRLDTGRFHQIRVMLSALGFPLIGDTDYGGRSDRRSPADFPRIDLEAIALRIMRGGTPTVHWLRQHPDRRGLSPRIESVLADAVSVG